MSIDVAAALRRASSNPDAIPRILAEAAAGFGATDVDLLLVDFGQTVLTSITAGRRPREPETVSSTMAGRAFTDQVTITAERDGFVRVWIPVREGSDRTGVVALSLETSTDDMLEFCDELGLLAGYLIAAQARCTDLYHRSRRREAMSLAASMQWDLLPPLVLVAGPVSVAGLVEPAYDVGGDAFDYAANGSAFEFAIMDAMGHGSRSAVISSLAVGCYRNGRRARLDLVATHLTLAATMEEHSGGESFVTGMLGCINPATGIVTMTNAGHPPPLLIRAGHVVGSVECEPTPPWGIAGRRRAPALATEQLEPGDSLLLYTDGVVEARSPDGDRLGLERLIDLTQRVASDEARPEQTVRHLVQSVRDHQVHELADDATAVILRWDGPPNS